MNRNPPDTLTASPLIGDPLMACLLLFAARGRALREQAATAPLEESTTASSAAEDARASEPAEERER